VRPPLGAAPHAIIDRPSIGSAYLARKSSTPWAVVAGIALAVLAVIAYIVFK
jgi:hypothetical protein